MWAIGGSVDPVGWLFALALALAPALGISTAPLLQLDPDFCRPRTLTASPQ